MKINTQEIEHNVKLITLKGIINEDSIDLVQGTFSSVFNLGSYKIVCDMENVEHISAPVIKSFLENIATTQYHGGDLKLLNVHSSIQAIFRYAGFTNEEVFSSDLRVSLQHFEHISTPSQLSNGERVDPFAETIMPINKLSRPLQDHIQSLDSSHIEKLTSNEQSLAKHSSDYDSYGETLLNIQDYMKDQAVSDKTTEQTLRMIDPPSKNNEFNAHGETLTNEFDVRDYVSPKSVARPIKRNTFQEKISKTHVVQKKTIKKEESTDKIRPKSKKPVAHKPLLSKKQESVIDKAIPKKQELVIEKATPKKQEPVIEKAIPKKQELVIEKATPKKQEPVTEKAIPKKQESAVQKTTPKKQESVVQKTTPKKRKAVAQKTTPKKREIAVQKIASKKQPTLRKSTTNQKEGKSVAKPIQKQVTKKDNTSKKNNAQKPMKNAVPKATKNKIIRTSAIPNKKTSHKSKFINAINEWNNCVPAWHKIPINFDISDPKQVVTFIKNASAVRSNVVSSVGCGKGDKSHVLLFSNCWVKWKACLEGEGFTIYPDIGGYLRKAVGKVIYCHSQRAKVQKVILVVPGVKKDDKEYISPVSTVILPTTVSFPNNHPARSLPLHWRSILGELELLSIHARIQPKAKCTIENLTQKSPMLLHSNRNVVVSEIKKRKQTFERLLLSKTSDYKIATYYSPLEECFWSLYHDDRPIGHSFLDKIRKRVQEWHSFIKRKHRITVKHFVAKKDLAKSIEPYVEKTIIQKHPDVAKGKVVRQLCPALIVKVNNSNRILKGRIIST
ncbi:STAS domain-containing protein [Candidatus Uabimicrobium sp. HlEnr_7]|uniref:STAS domain-containing protein n=1 Tax=Candidatus Uabimicrobium helgolandensis TaxID=3095367 RepID=UPI0035591FE3